MARIAAALAAALLLALPARAQEARPLDALRKELRGGDGKARRQAAYALWGLRVDLRPAVKDLASALSDEDAYVADIAGRTLRRIGTWAVPVLDTVAEALSDDRTAVRRNAIEILINCRESAAASAPQAVEALAGDEDAVVRARAAVFLGVLAPRIGGSSFGPQAVAALGDALADPAPEVRAATAEALGSYGPAGAAALDPLLAAAGDESPGVRAAALTALGAVGASPRTLLPGVAKGLCDPEPAVKVAALPLAVLLDPGHPAIEATALAGLRSSSVPLRRAAAKALGRGVPEPAPVLEALRGALGDGDATVRANAAAALGGDAGSLDALIAAVRDPVPRVRIAAAGSLGNTGRAAGKAIPVLEAMARARDADSRRAALEALGRIR